MNSMGFKDPVSLTDVLYDKIIDVDLLLTSHNEQIQTILSLGGNHIGTEGLVVTAKVMGDRPLNNFEENENIVSPEATAKTSYVYYVPKNYAGKTIAIYKGQSHREYYEDNGRMRYREVVPSAQCDFWVSEWDRSKSHEGDPLWWLTDNARYKILQTLDSLESKVTDQGELAKKLANNGRWDFSTDAAKLKKMPTIEDGAQIIVRDGNGSYTYYHAVYVESDAIQTTEYTVEDHIRIKCSDTGIKPSIAFSTNLIPGNNCYKLILKFTNIQFDFDIRKITRIRVKAGYRTQGFTDEFDCPVFSSYIESPNPDGVTVFECLCVGRMSNFLESRPIRLEYIGGKITIGELIEKIAGGLNMKAYNQLLLPHEIIKEDGSKEYSPGYSGLEIKISKMSTYAENSPALLEWLRKVIQQRIAIAEGYSLETGVSLSGKEKEYPYVCVQIVNGGLYVFLLNRQNQDTAILSKNIVSMDMVKGASFNGVALTVKSVWNPRIKPGELFQMHPNIFNGTSLPNMLSREAFGDDKKRYYLFRCITASIAFSTNGPENEMSVLAIPIRYMESETVDDTVIKSLEQFAANSYLHYDTSGANVIELGQADPADTEVTEEKQKEEVVQSNTNDMFGVDIVSLFGETVDYVIQPGDTLSILAARWFDSSGAPNGQVYCSFPLDTDENDVPKGVYVGSLRKYSLWPIIAVLTYHYWLKSGGNSNRSSPYETMDNLAEPDKLKVGKHLVIPKIPDWNTLKRARNVFYYARKAYVRDHPNYQDYVYLWGKLVYYLGGNPDV